MDKQKPADKAEQTGLATEDDGNEVSVHRIDTRPQLTINHQVSFTQEQDIHAIQHFFTYRSDKQEQVYERHLKASKKWTVLDYGWIKNPSYIAIINNAKDTQCSLLVAYGPMSLLFQHAGGFIILPGACQIFYPTSPKNLFISSPYMEDVAYTLHVFPK